MYLQGVFFESYWCLLVKGQWVKYWNFHDPCICSRNSHSGWKQRYLQQSARNTAEIRVCFGLSFATLFLFLTTPNGIRNKELGETFLQKSQFSKRKSGNDPSFGIIRHITLEKTPPKVRMPESHMLRWDLCSLSIDVPFKVSCDKWKLNAAEHIFPPRLPAVNKRASLSSASFVFPGF